MRKKPERLRARMKAAVHDAILEAAERTVAEDGVEAASLQAVARRAGIAVGTIYNHFEDRQELFTALFDARRAEMLAAVDASLKEHAREPAARQLTAFVESVLGHFERRRDFLRVAFATESLRMQMMRDKRPMLVQLEERAARIIARGVREKVFRAEGAELYGPAFVGMMRGALLSRLLGEGHASKQEAVRLVELFLHGAARR